MPNLFSLVYENFSNQSICLEEKTIYSQFLEAKVLEFQTLRASCSENELKTCYEIHHILPRHAGGLDNLENLIPLTPEDHALAHYYRYCVTKDLKDLWVWNLRKNPNSSSFLTPNGRLALARQLFHQHSKQERKYFWDSIWQQEQGQKGAHLGGLKNTPKQKNARKETGRKLGKRYGKVNGRIQGVKNQKQQTRALLQFHYEFIHKKHGTFEISPQTALVDLAEQCLSFVNFQNSFETRIEKRELARQLGRLLRQERKSYHGWCIRKK